MKDIKGSTKKKTYEFVLSSFLMEGYRLLSTKYVNSREKLHSVCPKGHSYHVSFTLFHNRGFRCPECSGNKAYTVETASLKIKQHGCTPMFSEYKKNTIPLHIRCPNNHDWFVTLNNLDKHGLHCPQCSGIIRHHTFEFVEKFFESQKYTLLSKKFINSNTPLSVLCPKKHPWRVRFGDFYNSGYRCSSCSDKGTSLAEKELKNIIGINYPSVLRLQDRKVKIEKSPYIKGFHIDIYIPELRKGIEFDGTYHHSVKGLRRGRPHWSENQLESYHQIKDDWFASKGIRILHIKEEDWKKDKEKCVQKCLEFLGC